MVRGSVRYLDGGWSFRVDAGMDPATGRRRQVSRQGFVSEDDARAALAVVLDARHANVVPTKTTVSEFLMGWIDRRRSSMKSSTWVTYRQAVVRVTESIGDALLVRLSSADLDRCYTSFMSEGLAVKTVRNIHAILHLAFADAVRGSLLAKNPADGIDLPVLDATPERRTWTVGEVGRFLRGTQGHRLHAAFVLLSTTGMRRSEVLGLRWGDIDTEARLINVRRTVTMSRAAVEVSDLACRVHRQIALDEATFAAVVAHGDAVAGGPGLERFVFENRRSRDPLNPASFSATFDRLVQASGLPTIGVRDLRHTYAELAIKAGVPIEVVSQRLGHATVTITVDMYGEGVRLVAAQTSLDNRERSVL